MTNLAEFENHLRRINRSERTVEAYISDAQEFLTFAGPREPSVALVEEWVTSLRFRLKPQSVARKLASVRSLLGHAAAHGNDEAAKVLVVLENYQVVPKVRQTDVERPQVLDRETYLAARAATTGRGRAILDILWHTGARISEVLGDARIGIPPLTVQDGRTLVERGYVTTNGKGGKRRTILLGRAGRDALSEYVASLQGWSGPLFPMTRQAVQKRLARLHLPSPHAFRHAYRSRLRRANFSDEMMRALMGHGPRDVTQAYGAVTIEEMLNVVENLD